MMKVRNRLVSFRVTDEELEHMKAASLAQGTRCLSDFARAASLHITRSSSTKLPPSDLAADRQICQDDRLSEYERRLAAIELQISRIVLEK